MHVGGLCLADDGSRGVFHRGIGEGEIGIVWVPGEVL